MGISVQDRNKSIIKVAAVGILVNFLLFAGKIITGMAIDSNVIVLDAVNSLSDSVSCVFIIISSFLAMRNADRDFTLNEIEKDIISKHMFPLTPFLPRHRESFIVCLADKWCALAETFKIDVSSYIIYRINFQLALANGDYSIDYGETAIEV